MEQSTLDIATQSTTTGQLEPEQIQFINTIQSYGVLLVLAEPGLEILASSTNAVTVFGVEVEEILGKPLDSLIPESQLGELKHSFKNDDFRILRRVTMDLPQPGQPQEQQNREHKNSEHKNRLVDAIFHRNQDGLLILELEPNPLQAKFDFLGFYQSIRATAGQLKQTADLHSMCQVMAQEVRSLTQFDRVMIYKFHEDWSGEVIAEAKQDDMDPLLGLHFPSIDTEPCRWLYAKHWIRLIADVNSSNVALETTLESPDPDGSPVVDLSFSLLRGVSPCHQEYLQNMGVQATLVMSLLKGEELWGLVSCHHNTPKHISYELRQGCEFLGQVLSTEFTAKEDQQNYKHRMVLKTTHQQLVESLSQAEQFLEGISQTEQLLLDLVNGQGMAVLWDGELRLWGRTPKLAEVEALVEWLNTKGEEELFVTDCLGAEYPEAASWQNCASGLLVITISAQQQILWFRPEFIQTLSWAGDPHQPLPSFTDDAGQEHLTPRKSFALWQETVLGKSVLWQPWEIGAAYNLRNALINIVLRQAQALAKLAQDLERSNAELEKFAYVASHDLQEPLNLVSSYIQLLEMRYKSQLGEEGQEFIGFAVEGVQHMQTLIDDLLAYSRVGSRSRPLQLTSVGQVFHRVRRSLQNRLEESQTTLTHDPLPSIMSDETQLVQVLQNLITNAIKFRSQANPKIHVGVESQLDFWLFSVQDNGIGLDPKFADRIFLIFQRLHTREEYPGTGIGLAICKKIIDRHGGQIWVESQLNQGSKFFFTIPK
jgi:chemotaxis family two-component system sensor kinase Cph1